MKIIRFTLIQRCFHLFLMLSFLVQSATGVGRMYVETGFGQTLLAPFGGFHGALAVHKWVGIFMLILFGVHLIYLLGVSVSSGKKVVTGPDSILPYPRDIKPALAHIGWLFGLKKHPRFDRWAYWEKFDYWAVFWGMVIIGGTGLILYSPLATSELMPGWMINVSFWVHRIEAILAMGHVFIIHFAVGHLRRRHFPMDKAIFTGYAGLTSIQSEKRAWIDRLEKEGTLDRLTGGDVSVQARVAAYAIGFLAILTGLYILFGGLFNMGKITW
jgi:cytochrome b subunit of formate dehydrogenase